MRTVVVFLATVLSVVGALASQAGPLRQASPPRQASPRAAKPAGEALPLQRLWALAAQPPGPERAAALDAQWQSLVDAGHIPWVRGRDVTFLYRGSARSVRFVGDFNGWNLQGPEAERLGDLDVWFRKESFPRDARLDYKIVVDGDRWRLDPAHDRRQLGGYGENSVLFMPEYVPSPWIHPCDDVAAGALTEEFLDSAVLGETLRHVVYTPPGYDALDELPLLVVTDGHEYAHPDMGSLPIVADNLLAAGRIRPVVMVFLDPRIAGRNRRRDLYVCSEDFPRYVAQELLPAIEARYRIRPDRSARGILGTSLGGLNSAWFAVELPQVFSCIAIQSPAFQASEGRILERFRQSPPRSARIHMTWGTFHDFGETTLQMQALLEEQGLSYRVRTVHEGHSWGHWRALLDDVLVYFWPAEPSESRIE